MDITITHNRDEQRFEGHTADGELASFAEYSEDGTVRNFNHTVTAPKFGGQGLAGQVVQFALDDTKAAGMTIVPSCWYVRDWVSGHPEYAELLHS